MIVRVRALIKDKGLEVIAVDGGACITSRKFITSAGWQSEGRFKDDIR